MFIYIKYIATPPDDGKIVGYQIVPNNNQPEFVVQAERIELEDWNIGDYLGRLMIIRYPSLPAIASRTVVEREHIGNYVCEQYDFGYKNIAIDTIDPKFYNNFDQFRVDDVDHPENGITTDDYNINLFGYLERKLDQDRTELMWQEIEDDLERPINTDGGRWRNAIFSLPWATERINTISNFGIL